MAGDQLEPDHAGQDERNAEDPERRGGVRLAVDAAGATRFKDCCSVQKQLVSGLEGERTEPNPADEQLSRGC